MTDFSELGKEQPTSITETQINTQSISDIIDSSTVDIQVKTAQLYKRNLPNALKNILFLATQDKETADNCFYSVRRDGKTIRGASIRLAEIITACYGNIRASSRIVSNDGKMVTAQGMCWDLENNVAFSVEVNRRITDKQGRTFSDDLIVITSNACASIALRNAIFKVVPQAITSRVQTEIKKIVLGEAKDFNTTRLAAIEYFTELGVSEKQILDLFNKKTVEDLDRDDIFDLRGIATAIKEGDTTLESSFSIAPKTNSAIGKASKVLSVPLEEGNAEYEKTNTFQASAIGQEKWKVIDKVETEIKPVYEDTKEKLPDIDAFGDNSSFIQTAKEATNFNKKEVNVNGSFSVAPVIIHTPNELNDKNKSFVTTPPINQSIQNNEDFLSQNNSNNPLVIDINTNGSKTEILHIKGSENTDLTNTSNDTKPEVKIPKIEPITANFGSDFEISATVFTEKEPKATKDKKVYKKYIKKADREKIANSELQVNKEIKTISEEKQNDLGEPKEENKEVDKKDLFNN
jgi:hypothetical protein